MMGPCPLIYGGMLGLPAPPLCELLAAVWAALGVERRDVKAAMLCETPSANMNCSRSSMLVRPLAVRSVTHTHIMPIKHQPPHARTEREKERCAVCGFVFCFFFFGFKVCFCCRANI